MIDGTKQRKKHAINNKDRDGMLKYKPDYHDNKFTTNNELPYKEYPIMDNKREGKDEEGRQCFLGW